MAGLACCISRSVLAALEALQEPTLLTQVRHQASFKLDAISNSPGSQVVVFRELQKAVGAICNGASS
jgi:hypothetical protein